jgi:hypothetical protein
MAVMDVARSLVSFGVPSAEGAHIATIRAMPNNSWLALGTGAPDPQWGAPTAATWGSRQPWCNPYRGAWYYNEISHGYDTIGSGVRAGRLDDSLWFYDLNAHRWLCLYPGTDSANYAALVASGEVRAGGVGLVLDKQDRIIPQDLCAGHNWSRSTYDEQRNLWLFHVIGNATATNWFPSPDYTNMHDACIALQQQGLAWSTTTPMFYDPLAGRFHYEILNPGNTGGHAALYSDDGSAMPITYIPAWGFYLVASRGGTAYYDYPNKQWWLVNPVGLHVQGRDHQPVVDTLRNRVYYIGGIQPEHPENQPWTNNFWSFDASAAFPWSWTQVHPGGAGTNALDYLTSNGAFVFYDTANDVVLALSGFGIYGVFAWHPATNVWEALPDTMPTELRARVDPGGIGLNSNVGYYDPTLGVCVLHFGNTPGSAPPVYGMETYIYKYKNPAPPTVLRTVTDALAVAESLAHTLIVSATVFRSLAESLGLADVLTQVLNPSNTPPIVDVTLTQQPGLSARIFRKPQSIIRQYQRTLPGETFTLLSALASILIPAAPAGSSYPRLCFSDLDSGPRLNNSDTSMGQTPNAHGAWVSIYGTNLGATQGTSSVRINGALCVYIKYWGPAVPPWSPATLVNGMQQLQMVIAQVPGTALDGAGQILVTVNGITSNALPFTVRPGKCVYASTSGQDGAAGTYQAPKFSPQAAYALLTPGQNDVAYLRDGVTTWGLGVMINNSGVPLAIGGYPGATVNLGDTANNAISLGASGAGAMHTYFKMRLTGPDNVVMMLWGSRLVGCYVTAPTAAGATGTIEFRGSAMRVVGCEFDDCGLYGDDLYHVIYLGGYREQGAGWFAEEDREIAYCFIHDCDAVRAINTYNGENRGGWPDTAWGSNPLARTRVHHCLIVNQISDGIGFQQGIVGENWATDNVIINAGRAGGDAGGSNGGFYLHAGWAPTHYPQAGNILHIWNNTIVHCGAVGGNAAGAFYITSTVTYAWTPDFHNNLIYQLGSGPCVAYGSAAPPVGTSYSSHNGWYGPNVPTWDTTPMLSDPLLVDVVPPDYDVRLQLPSPARGAGVNLGIASTDFAGVDRPAAGAWDLGAFQGAAA